MPSERDQDFLSGSLQRRVISKLGSDVRTWDLDRVTVDLGLHHRLRGSRSLGRNPAADRARPPLNKESPMTLTVLYPEDRQVPDLTLEQDIFGPEVRLIRAAKPSFAELDPNDCAAAYGLMIMRWAVTAADLDRFPRLRCVVRMGIGYDKLDRKALAERNILVCNVPDYGIKGAPGVRAKRERSMVRLLVGEGRKGRSFLKGRPVVVINPEVERIVRHHPEHQPVARRSCRTSAAL